MFCCRACKNNVGHGPLCEKRLRDSVTNAVLPTAYCINLDREPQKFEKIQKEFKGVLNVMKVSAIDGELHKIPGRIALRQTNKILFRKFASSNYKLPYAIVLEDDIYKLPQFHAYWPKIAEFINKGEKWDFISLDFHCRMLEPVINPHNSFLYRIGKNLATGFMIYNTKFIRKNLRYLLSMNKNVDVYIKWIPRFRQLIPNQLLVKQNVNKLSKTANRNTRDYEQWYNVTRHFLRIHSNSKDADHSK